MGPVTAPFAANFFIAAERDACGTNDIKISDLVSYSYRCIRRSVRSLNCEYASQGAGAFADLVILGGGGKLEAELASGTYDPAKY
jgi:hypothetical protein